MHLIRGIHNLRPSLGPHALTIGNFDGVHAGHQAMLAQLREAADRLGVPAMVMCFEPQPQEFFSGEQAPGRLMTWRDKVETLAEYGVDRVLLVRFDERFRAYTASGFIDDLLVAKLQTKYILAGDDFRFGCDRSGDYSQLQRAGVEHDFAVDELATFESDGDRVSSTRLRAAVAAADFALARALSGRDFFVAGHVVHGDKIGRTLGLPTANILMKRQVLPLRGVFAVWVDGIGDTPLPAVANVGTRPTVQGIQARCEVHLLDYRGDLYGRRLRVRFAHKLRDEQRFASLEALKSAIEADVIAGHHYFSAEGATALKHAGN
ncbi:MAG: bifunctional riboflavin kinase/FAD synthetase [Paraperlucidibaca sp.]|uniref:bifunctional riboflavin kinase/FAD synthetase n=1 Tax=Paraperlucidibaca sp. TaxID=2708021 RepID=UPI001B43861C|nr:bifunctional riboflavin kinase/FAD synthetase [Paraperlucidibaca sp.]MBQ0722927.1 bifunctional riboflavin kinase/FAD synthetase [Paraperlucidibaca sp.]MBQ0841471.1 bifunctional riboflavin kinase/FAD synthetase [Paraperlucidibaca sp.]